FDRDGTGIGTPVRHQFVIRRPLEPALRCSSEADLRARHLPLRRSERDLLGGCFDGDVAESDGYLVVDDDWRTDRSSSLTAVQRNRHSRDPDWIFAIRFYRNASVPNSQVLDDDVRQVRDFSRW